jgi:hypothetical protein
MLFLAGALATPVYAIGVALDASKATGGDRLIVLAVDSPREQTWQNAVKNLATFYSDVALIDVSQPTKALVWEVEYLTHVQPMPCVFVAERSQATAVLTADSPDAYARQMRELLNGRTVLTYDASDRRSRSRFVDALRRSLEVAVTSEREHILRQVDTAREPLGRFDPPAGLGCVGLVDSVALTEQARASRARRRRSAVVWWLFAGIHVVGVGCDRTRCLARRL